MSPPQMEYPPFQELSACLSAGEGRAWTPIDLRVVWRRLVDGDEVVLETSFTDSHCALLLAPRQGSRPRPCERQQAVLDAVLRGVGQKRVALELALSPSTVASNARLALERLGVSGRPSRVHPLLMLAASAATCPRVQIPSVETPVVREGELARLVVVPRPDLSLRGMLPRAEQEVVKRLVEGRCYAEISRWRGTSFRTTANQIAGAFRRLGVSGRSELIQRLFVLSGWLPDLPRAA